MKIIYNNIFPFGQFIAITLPELIIVHKNKLAKYGIAYRNALLNHEKIHIAQQRELLYIGFYLWYAVEWLVRLIIDYKTAYRSISFEQEAYTNQHKTSYLAKRKHFAWVKYLKSKEK